MKDTVFCSVCCHSVYDMGKHITTEEHKRNLRRNGNVSNLFDGLAEQSKMIDAMHKVDPALLPKADEPIRYHKTNDD